MNPRTRFASGDQLSRVTALLILSSLLAAFVDTQGREAHSASNSQSRENFKFMRSKK